MPSQLKHRPTIECLVPLFQGTTCHLPPMQKCPLCQFMEDSPCADVFQVWEDCLNANEAEGGSDEERQERFMKECSDPTLALKACVEKHPDHFGEMFGGGPEDVGKDQPPSGASVNNPTAASAAVDDDAGAAAPSETADRA